MSPLHPRDSRGGASGISGFEKNESSSQAVPVGRYHWNVFACPTLLAERVILVVRSGWGSLVFRMVTVARASLRSKSLWPVQTPKVAAPLTSAWYLVFLPRRVSPEFPHGPAQPSAKDTGHDSRFADDTEGKVPRLVVGTAVKV